MTDLELFLTMYKAFGVEIPYPEFTNVGFVIELDRFTSEKFKHGFGKSLVSFDSCGKFVDQYFHGADQ